jgi:hypothetical protein
MKLSTLAAALVATVSSAVLMMPSAHAASPTPAGSILSGGHSKATPILSDRDDDGDNDGGSDDGDND